ncbi:MAG: hypothetical protein ACYTXA_19635 [Nostoc sp.]
MKQIGDGRIWVCADGFGLTRSLICRLDSDRSRVTHHQIRRRFSKFSTVAKMSA